MNKIIFDYLFGFGSTPDEFSPGIIPNLTAWFDATILSSITRDVSDKVSQWDDLSGNGNHATQNTATLQPTYAIQQINGKPAISYNGSTQRLLVNSLLSGGQARTIFIVARSDETTIHNALFNFSQTHTGDGTHFAVIAYWHTHTACAVFLGGNKRFDESLSGGDSGIITSMLPQNGTINDTRMFKDGHELDSIGSNKSTTAVNTQASGCFIGYGPFTNANLNGGIGEILVFDRELDSSELLSIHQYLSDKWGVTLA